MPKLYETDTRVTPTHRRIVLEILDNTPIDIPSKDLDILAEEFEEILQKRYDMKIDSINCVQRVIE